MARYLAIFGTFARACLVRDMTFRANFLLECLTSLGWMSMNLAFYLLVFTFTPEIGKDSGWTREPFFAFVATGMIINAIVQALFMPSASELTEMVRNGGLDAVLVKPLDAQFLLSMHRVDFSALANGTVGLVLLGWAVSRFSTPPAPVAWLVYPLLILCGVAILYAMVI
ncbi:MAG: ABC-2 family transporter protein, partial [Pirellulales bacterium]|nr:ABC-2 family transporter protein [Pirellulales bacterium]